MAAYTVTGEYTGTVFAENIGYDAAIAWFESYDEAPALLLELDIGAAWKSHEDARGVKITRTA